MQDIYTPTKARQNLFQIIEDVNTNHKAVHIVPVKDGKKGVHIISDDDYNAMIETLYLEEAGVMAAIKHRQEKPELVDAFDMLAEVENEPDVAD